MSAKPGNEVSLKLTLTDIQRLLLLMDVADTIAGGLSEPERELKKKIEAQKQEQFQSRPIPNQN